MHIHKKYFPQISHIYTSAFKMKPTLLNYSPLKVNDKSYWLMILLFDHKTVWMHSFLFGFCLSFIIFISSDVLGIEWGEGGGLIM